MTLERLYNHKQIKTYQVITGQKELNQNTKMLKDLFE